MYNIYNNIHNPVSVTILFFACKFPSAKLASRHRIVFGGGGGGKEHIIYYIVYIIIIYYVEFYWGAGIRGDKEGSR